MENETGDSGYKPLIAMTIGDPTGIGPEVIAGALRDADLHQWCRPFVVGHSEYMRRAVALLGLPIEVVGANSFESIKKFDVSPALLPCLDVLPDNLLSTEPCRVSPEGGQAAYESVVCAARLALDQQVDAIVTAPLHKKALRLAGHEYPGHTELLADLCGVDDFAMMLYLGPDATIQSPAGLAVVHVTLHTSMRQVLENLNVSEVVAKIRLADRFMAQVKGERPRIAVCSLNPHGGESGLFGDEEHEIIAPAVERAKSEGIDVSGPYPTDTMMIDARDGRFDAVVAMYHDQGHIALKLLGMHRAVNVTLGLPIIRTSVAHGTAYDKAWQGIANCGSMVEAVRIASLMARKTEN